MTVINSQGKCSYCSKRWIVRVISSFNQIRIRHFCAIPKKIAKKNCLDIFDEFAKGVARSNLGKPYLSLSLFLDILILKFGASRKIAPRLEKKMFSENPFHPISLHVTL